MSLLNRVRRQKEIEHILTLWICFMSTSFREKRESQIEWSVLSKTQQIISKLEINSNPKTTTQLRWFQRVNIISGQQLHLDYYWTSYLISWLEKAGVCCKKGISWSLIESNYSFNHSFSGIPYWFVWQEGFPWDRFEKLIFETNWIFLSFLVYC